MDTVIYSASPLEAFWSTGLTIVVMLALGIYGMVSSVFGRNQKLLSRIGWGAAGGLLVIIGGLSALNTMRTITGSTQSVIINLDRKRVVQSNCNDGQTCTSYVLETVSPTRAYDFDVPRQAYDKAIEGTCYQFTYYTSKGLFSDPSAMYQHIDTVTRIQAADPARCQ